MDVVQRVIPLALVAALGLAGCSGASGQAAPTASVTLTDQKLACSAAVAGIVTAVNDMVVSYESGTGRVSASASASGQVIGSGSEGLSEAVAHAKSTMSTLGCDAAASNVDLEQGLAGIKPDGAIPKAVWRRVSASLLGKIEAQASERTLSATEDLEVAVSQAAAGSTLVLPAGTRELTETVVLLDGIVLAGSGRDATTLHSTAPDAAVIVATDSRVKLRDLTLDLAGGPAASGVVAGSTATLALSHVRVSGAVADASSGGAGVQLSAVGTEGSGRGTTLEVTDSVFARNKWAGLVVGGGHRVSIEGSTFEGNGAVGLLFSDSASGSVARSTFTDNGVGVAVIGQATPNLLSSTVTGGTIGLQFSGTSAPAVDGLRVSGASSAAVVFGDEASGVIAHVVCSGVAYGIVVGNTSAPTLKDNTCKVSRGS